jgi:hypothetical protein
MIGKHPYKRHESASRLIAFAVGVLVAISSYSLAVGASQSPENFKIDVALIVQLRFSDVGQ